MYNHHINYIHSVNSTQCFLGNIRPLKSCLSPLNKFDLYEDECPEQNWWTDNNANLTCFLEYLLTLRNKQNYLCISQVYFVFAVGVVLFLEENQHFMVLFSKFDISINLFISNWRLALLLRYQMDRPFWQGSNECIKESYLCSNTKYLVKPFHL